MNTTLKITVLSSLAIALTACSANQKTQEVSFPYTGGTLSVVNANDNMPVTVTTSSGSREVTVELQTQTKGKPAGTPAWSLENGVLNLGTPCNTGFVGYCEGRYRVEVPRGTRVLVNGVPRSTE